MITSIPVLLTSQHADQHLHCTINLSDTMPRREDKTKRWAVFAVSAMKHCSNANPGQFFVQRTGTLAGDFPERLHWKEAARCRNANFRQPFAEMTDALG